MPAPEAPTEIVPELVIPPMKVETFWTSMPTPERPTEIVPELLIPPEKMVASTAMPMPCAVIVPELLMPPEKLLTALTTMPTPLRRDRAGIADPARKAADGDDKDAVPWPPRSCRNC